MSGLAALPQPTIESEMPGENFCHGGYAPQESLRMLKLAGFEVLLAEIDDPSSRGHLVVIATGQ
jgi:hypothetical protein